MKRSWLIGAALIFSLSAVACSDDDDEPTPGVDGGNKADAGEKADGSVAPGLDGGLGIDSGIQDGGKADGGDAG